MTGISLKKKKYNNFNIIDPYTIAVQASNNSDVWFLVDTITWLWLHRFYWSTRAEQIHGNNTYMITTFFGKKLSYHVLILSAPEGYIRDHINRNKYDNRYCNLRVILRGENSFNQKIPITNTSGIKGVSYDKKENTYRAHLQACGQEYSIRCDSLESAKREREALEKVFFNFHTIDTPKLINPDGTLNQYFPFGQYSIRYLAFWWALGLRVIPCPLGFKYPEMEFYEPNPEIILTLVKMLKSVNYPINCFLR